MKTNASLSGFSFAAMSSPQCQVDVAPWKSPWPVGSTIDVIYVTILSFIFYCPKPVVE
jgi:hypothetical protein